MLSLEEKVGQMMMVGFDGLRPPTHILEWLASGRIGGIYLFARNIAAPAQVKQLVADCRAAAKYPILVGIDQEGGIVARLRDGFSESPGAMALGAAGSSALAEDVATMMGRELAALGINWNFAPVADIAHQPDNPSVSTRSVGNDKHLVSQIVAAQVRGFQRAGIAATVKHFPGLGKTVIDTHDALAKVAGSLDYLYEVDLAPFRAAKEAGVACVMLTHVMFEMLDSRYPATLSQRIVAGLLRGEMGYDGVVCTDCMEMKAITDSFGAGESAVLAVLAGIDMTLFSHTRSRQEAAIDALLNAAKSGRIPPVHLDAAVARIRLLKSNFALKEQPPFSIVGCEAHRSLSLRAARAGTVLVKRGSALPLNSTGTEVMAIEFVSRRISDAVDGPGPSKFATLLAKRLPDAASHTLDPRMPALFALPHGLDDADTVILVTRSAHMQSRQLQMARTIIERAQRVILICARNPYDAGLLTDADSIICANGDSSPSLLAAVEALLGDYTPSGELTVCLP